MRKLLTLLFAISCLTISAKQVEKIVSPNKAVTVIVNSADGQVTMDILHGEKTVAFERIPLGIVTSKRDFSIGMTVKGNSGKHSISDSYTMRTGKRLQCFNEANARTIWMKNQMGEELDVEIRAYNDGVTFRYIIPKPIEGETLSDEITSYNIKEGKNRWLQIYHPDSYEDFYPLYVTGVNDGNVKQGFYKNQDHQWGYPALVEPASGTFALITEANIERDHCGTILSNAGGKIKPKSCCEVAQVGYKVTLGDDKAPIIASESGKWESPWRVVILGSLSTIAESTLVTDVSKPSANEKMVSAAGKEGVGNVASWIYWAYNHGSQDCQLVNKYTDLAVEMGWPYTLIDAEWDVMKNGTIEDAVKYAVEKGIKPMIWYNSGANWTGPSAPTPQGRIDTPEQMNKEFAWLKSIGVVGIKVDFFKNDNTWSMNKYIDLLEAAEKNDLMIVFHGCTIPRGWQRTYPHLMTCEAVYGAEWYNNNATLTNKAAAHNATLPFTRNVVGSMDYTPGTFTDSQNKHITSHGHELALTVLFESGIQHMPDRPESYLSMPSDVKQLLSTLPTAWDDTKLISGYPGKSVVMARKKGDSWYIAGINGTDEAEQLTVDFQALKLKNGATIKVFKDGADDHSFSIEEMKYSGPISIPCLPRGGFVAVVKN